jgi:hypothetical protein
MLRYITHGRQIHLKGIIAAAEGNAQLPQPVPDTGLTGIQRFLNEGSTEQSCILALGEKAGDLQISPLSK